MSRAVEIAALGVRFNQLNALRDVSLSVGAGEVAILLGPNGAGKTTTVETLLGFRRPSSGTVRLLGLDPLRARAKVMVRVGALLQRGGVWFPMSPRDVLRLSATYYPDPRGVDELLDVLELSRCAATPWRRLSGGEQQRTLLALALLARPGVLVLDEPTSAVDPEGHVAIRRIISEERARGCAVLITTHQLDDAEALGDHVTILRDGTVVAAGTPRELAGEPVLVIECSRPCDPTELSRRLGVDVTDEGDCRYRCRAPNTPENLAIVTAYLDELDARLVSLRTRTSLAETYLALMAENREVPS